MSNIIKNTLCSIAAAAVIVAPSLDTIIERVQTTDISPTGIVEVFSPENAYAGEKEAVAYFRKGFDAYDKNDFETAFNFYEKSRLEFEHSGLSNTPNYAAVLSELADTIFFLWEDGKKSKADIVTARGYCEEGLRLTQHLVSDKRYACSIGGLHSQISVFNIILGNKSSATHHGKKAVEFCPENAIYQNNYRQAREM
jgi:hypothetical protein